MTYQMVIEIEFFNNIVSTLKLVDFQSFHLRKHTFI